MKKILLGLLVFLCSTLVWAQRPIRVACVGNSVTYGTGIADRSRHSYPVQLQALLGDRYEVRNFGHPGATLSRNGHRPYHKLPEFKEALQFKADRVVIHLGLNDTDPRNWPNFQDEFVSDYRALIDSFRVANPKAQIWICRMTPIFHRHKRFQSGTRDWHGQIQKRIEQVAHTYNVGLIDLFDPLHSRPELFPDALHPNPEGAGIIARKVYGAITGNYGGLQLPATYGDGMVLQREKPIVLTGRANANETIQVKFNHQQRKTRADADGNWSVTFPAQYGGGPYTLHFISHNRKISFKEVWVGEVWLCSGQSNMAFMLQQCATAGSDISEANYQPRLHLYNMENLVPTAAIAWDSVTLDSVNRLHYVQKGKWTTCNSKTAAAFSAIAYHFGRVLADSLGCHVGLICNAVGGSTTESWIDRTTLEYEYPAILYNWLQNDHTQEWARQRAAQNIQKAKNPLQRHPYEPCYLFESGIAPLKDYTLRGVIWYQGESNAHNIELHERLFPLLQSSWRKFWNDPKLPFHFVQLSSIATRHSWPLFRDSQRRLADGQPNTWMTVCSDLGHRTDVHPTAKRPVGERLAFSALYHTYLHHNILPSGPEMKEVTYDKKKAEITFRYGEGLQAADGKRIEGFEIAGKDGIYYPAIAKKSHEGIIVYCKNVKEPCAVRYGWQPFSEANLVNEAMLPCSTFKDERFPW